MANVNLAKTITIFQEAKTKQTKTDIQVFCFHNNTNLRKIMGIIKTPKNHYYFPLLETCFPEYSCEGEVKLFMEYI